MKSLHVEGTGWLYRVSPPVKLLTLMGFSIALFLTRDLPLLGCAVVLAAAILRETRLPFHEIGLRLRPVMLTIFLVAGFSYLLLPAHDASVNLLRLTALALLATAVTITVSISQFMDEITRAAAPWNGWGWSRPPISDLPSGWWCGSCLRSSTVTMRCAMRTGRAACPCAWPPSSCRSSL